jgi:hypothetical protein
MYKVITRQSASLNSCIASPMAGADHNTICKFEHKFTNYIKVTGKLRNLRGLVLSQASATSVEHSV